jgi:hypothetical protein
MVMTGSFTEHQVRLPSGLRSHGLAHHQLHRAAMCTLRMATQDNTEGTAVLGEPHLLEDVVWSSFVHLGKVEPGDFGLVG